MTVHRIIPRIRIDQIRIGCSVQKVRSLCGVAQILSFITDQTLIRITICCLAANQARQTTKTQDK